MRLTLTDGQRGLRKEFRVFADTHIAPHASRHDTEERVDRSIVARLAEAGYLAPTDFDPIAYGLLHEEIGRACSSVRSLLTVHDMVADTVRRWGTPDQRARWSPRLASGDRIGAFALSEPGAGSDAGGITTTAEPAGDGFVLSGVKKWISFGQIAGVFLVFAMTPAGPTAFLVERDRPGCDVVPLHGMLGTRGAMLAEVRFDGCAVPGDAVLGGQGKAHPFITTSALTLGRLSVACGSVGIVQGCVDVASKYARERGVIQHQLVQRMLSTMIVGAEAGRLLSLRAAELIWSASPDGPAAATRAKYFAAVAAADAARDAVQILGAAGCSPDHPVSRYYRDAKVMEVIEGGNEISQTTIGRFGHGGRW
jgi:glutaryl-CoA dehydrogenase (non-decarboxylating)